MSDDKKTFQKYGHLPEKVAEADPWDVLCIDLIGPYTIERKNKTKKRLTLWALTMIDPATGWFKMREIKTKSADSVANVLEQAWLMRYPRPTVCLLSSELGFWFGLLLNNYWTVRPETWSDHRSSSSIPLLSYNSKVRIILPIVWCTLSAIAFACGFCVIIGFTFTP